MFSLYLCKMAESVNMALNHVLCFIFSKLQKSDENSVK